MHRLRPLGCRIQRMSIALFLVRDLRPERILKETRTCTMVESISYTSWPPAASGSAAAVMEELGLDKKPFLSYLELNAERCGAVTEALRFAGHCTGALRVFMILCQVQAMGAFDPVAKVSPSLEEVHISFSMEREGGRARFAFGELVKEDLMDDLLEAFGVCLSLRQLIVLTNL